MNSIRRNRSTARVALALVGALALVAVGFGTADRARAEKDADGAYMGVFMQELTRDVRKGLDLDVRNGVLISGVADDSPADKAGIEDGDVIVEFNGSDVKDPEELSELVGALEPGQTVKVVVVREGKRKKITLKLTEKPDEFVWSTEGSNHFAPMVREITRNVMFSGPHLGVHAAELNDDLAAYFDTPDDSGVLVLDVIDDSMADGAGLKAGDVVLRVGDDTIDEISDIGDALEDFDEGDKVDVTVLRHGKKKTLSGEVKDAAREFSFNFRGPRHRVHRGAPHFRVEKFGGGEMGELREQLKELREEMRELKKEMRKKR